MKNAHQKKKKKKKKKKHSNEQPKNIITLDFQNLMVLNGLLFKRAQRKKYE